MAVTNDHFKEGARLFRRGWRQILLVSVISFAVSFGLGLLPGLLRPELPGATASVLRYLEPGWIVYFVVYLVVMLFSSAVGALFSLLPAAWALGAVDGEISWREALRLLYDRRWRILRVWGVLFGCMIVPPVAVLSLTALLVIIGTVGVVLAALLPLACFVFLCGLLLAAPYAYYYTLRDCAAAAAFKNGFKLLKKYFGKTLLVSLLGLAAAALLSLGGPWLAPVNFVAQMYFTLTLCALFRGAETKADKKRWRLKREL